MVRHVGASGRHLPLAPPHALETRPRLERERVERALERQRDPCRARERATPPPAAELPSEHAARHPGDQRVDRVQAVRVEVQAQRPAGRPRPAEHSAARRNESRLRQAQRIHVHAAVGEAQSCPPLSRPAPAKSDGPSAAVTAPAGAAPLSAPTVPASVTLSRDGGPAPEASQREKSRSRVRTVKSRAASRDDSSVSTPSTRTPPPSCADCRSACVASAASVPSSRTGPVTAPASGSPPPRKLARRPSNESESATTSANTPSVSLRLASRT